MSRINKLIKQRPKHYLSSISIQLTVYVKARIVYNGWQESLKDLKRNSCLSRLSLYQGCQPFDKHIKSISCGSQVTPILSL